MDKKYFPIKTKTACSLKWAWSTLYLNNGTTASCHRVGFHPVDIENFDNFHNTPEKITQRETMLNGDWPQPLAYMNDDEGCRYCEKIEAAGGMSDRQYHLQIPNLSPKELESNPVATSVTPTIVEVFLSNTCNLSCSYCGPQSSSVIEQENIKHGEFSKNGLTIPIYHVDRELNKVYIEKFFSWLDKNSNELRRLQLLGGEPLYQKEFYRCLDFFETHPNKNLELNVISNLMIDEVKFQQLIGRLKTMVASRLIARFDITVSIDCWGADQEYARYGLDLSTIEKNIELILKEKWIYFTVNSTLTPLTIKTFPDLIQKINKWRESRKVNHHFQTVFKPAHHNPDIFGGNFWINDINRALSLVPDTSEHKNTYDYLLGIKQQLQSTCENPEKIVQFFTHLDELDRRRNTNWRSVFPWLEKEYKKYVV